MVDGRQADGRRTDGRQADGGRAETREEPLASAVESQVTRKLRAQRRGERSVWFGFGMFGLIGWSVALPTILGAALGRWLDVHHPAGRSWTLALLIAGLVLGCLQAFHWISRAQRDIRNEGGRPDA